MEDLNEEKIINEDKNKYRCNICNSQEDCLLCDNCFKDYNSIFEDQRNNFINTGKSISKKIEILLKFNNEKSKKLNKKIYLEKYKQILESRIKQEETKINIYKEQANKYEQQKIIQQDNNNGLLLLLKDYNNNDENNLSDINDSGINNYDFNNDNDNDDDITKIKNEIFLINTEIKKYKKKYIDNLFQQYFIDKKAIIKISDFFNSEQANENNLNFSIIGQRSDELDNYANNKIKLDILENEDLLKRLNSFFKTMALFLENACNKFKIKLPFKINNSKVEYKNGFKYNIEINKNKLKNQSALSNVIKGYHLLNINYIYLMENVYGDSIKLNDWFDISVLLPELNDEIGSIKTILEESKNEKKEEEYNGFVIIDEE
jgi:hypothetical protein